jgi:hypothetical protein
MLAPAPLLLRGVAGRRPAEIAVAADVPGG